LGRFSRKQRASSFWFSLGKVPLNSIKTKIIGKNFIYYKDQFYLKNPKTNTYVVYDDNTYFMMIMDQCGYSLNEIRNIAN
jgi:hypothetical protein